MFQINYKIAFSETDPGGILFFTEFLKISHIAYERFFESLNLERDYFQDNKYILPIVNTTADFISPVKFRDQLKCEVSVGEIGDTSFVLNYTLRNGDKIAAKTKTKHVVVLKKSFKKEKIPDDLYQKLIENQT